MTLATIFQSVLGSSSSGRDRPSAPQSHGYFSEKNSGPADYYHYGSYKKSKGKSKSDKKHAILSALTLLAFLFFLNILQNCIREQSQNRGTMMMFLPTAPTGQQVKEPDPGQPPQQTENQFRKKRSAEQEEQRKKETLRKVVGRKTRTLLQIPASADSRLNPLRQVKFIRNFKNVNNWTRELSQLSDKDLEVQKLKTMNFPLYWKNNRLAPTETTQSSMVPTRETLVPGFSVSKNEKSPPVLRRITKRERTTTLRAVPKENGTAGTLPSNEAVQKVVPNYTDPNERKPEMFRGNKYHFQKGNEGFDQKQSHSFRQDSSWKGLIKIPNGDRNSTRRTQEITTPAAPPTPKNTATARNVLSAPGHAATTPRNKRSDHATTPGPTDLYDYDGLDDHTRERLRPAVGLDLNTFQTFPVYNYYNHRHGADLYRENETADTDTSETTEVTEIDRMHTEHLKPTTESPLFDPAKMSPSNLKPPFFKYRNKYRDHYVRYPTRNHYPQEYRYRYSPYRKAGTYDSPHFHDPLRDDYHVVLAKYPATKESGFDLVNFFWTMFASFAKPLTKLVPSFAKENDRESQCFDLLVCEAQRVSRFMGPTAEALTTTLGTLLTWAAAEDTRQSVVDALNSGRENTCQQQIRDCEGRSGGKSAMTVIAQLMEMKLR